MKGLLQYASRKRDNAIYDVTEILRCYYDDVLKIEGLVDGRNGNLAKKVSSLVKEFLETDPRYQSRMDQYAVR